MKKIFALLGASLALSGCFDEPKKESSQPNQSTASAATSTASEMPSSTSSLASSDKSTAAETSTQVANSSAQSSSSASSSSGAATDKPESQLPALKTEAKTETKTETQAASTDSHRTKLDSASDKSHQTQTETAPKNASKVNAKKQAQTTKPAPHRTKALKNTSTQEKYTGSGLSPEEIRVGYQQALNNDEINYLKQQCRYPFMSDKDLVKYRCAVKKVRAN